MLQDETMEEELIPLYIKRKELQLQNLSQIREKIIEILNKENKTLCDLIGLDWIHVNYAFDNSEINNTVVSIMTEICLQFGYKLEINFIKDENK